MPKGVVEANSDGLYAVLDGFIEDLAAIEDA